MQEVKLCLPCAERLKRGLEVKQITKHTDKETCAECHRRRFCYVFEVGGKKEPQ